MRLWTWASAVTLLATVSCGGAEKEKKVSATNPEGDPVSDTLVVGYISDIGNLISVVSETAADSDIMGNLSFGLVQSEFDCKLIYSPAMAKSWEWSEDGTVITMKLRNDILWDDGTPLSAHDLEFSYELVGDPKVASARLGYVEYLQEGKRPLIIDDETIEWHFTHAYDRTTQLAHASSVAALPKHILKDADRASLRTHALSKEPMSNGPWKMTAWEPNQRIVLEPNDKFTGPDDFKPYLKKVIFKIIPEYSTRMLELESGKIDMMQSILVVDADRLRKEHPEIDLVRRGYRSMDYMAWNLTNPLFSDKKVRQALAHAVDIEGMMGKLLKSDTGEVYGTRATGTLTPELCDIRNDDMAVFDHNMDKARRMLAEAGWTDTDGDGLLDKDGKDFSFTLATNSGNARRAEIQVLIQAALKDIGIHAELETIESNAFFENLRKRDFEAAVAGWSAGLFVDPSSIWGADTPEKRNEFNFTSYNNPEVDALIKKGLATPNPAEAAPIWREMQAKIYEDQPYMFLWWMDEIIAINNRFEDYEINLLSPLNNLQRWKVQPENVKYKR
jgi:peptide/nickel transport system substrate-binding protein